MSGSIMRAVLVLALTGLTAAGIGVLYSTGSSDSRAQDLQPVAFSHARHAGELKVDCLYCHRAATASSTAGVPSMHICITCHQNLAQEKPERLKLLAYWEDRKP